MAQTEGDSPLTTVYSRFPDIVIRTIAGETILVPVRGDLARMDQIFAVNSLGEEVWRNLDGHRTVASIIASVIESFDVEPGTARADVIEFVADLEDAGLVVVAGPPSPPEK